MVTWILVFWMLLMVGALIWGAANLHWENRRLQESIAVARHPSRQSWCCVCGAISLGNDSEVSDGSGMNHRTRDRCIPDLEAL